MATKAHRRCARELIEGLESRLHGGPLIGATEIAAARQFLERCSFSPASDYFARLAQIQTRVATRAAPLPAQTKRDYGGEAAGCWMQLQSIYDHVIVSTCYQGEFNTQRGRVKISHRFNRGGRIDFVELKFLRSLSPCLTGELRKLILVRDYQRLPQDWREAGAFTLPVLPRELVFLHREVFRARRDDALTWLINIGHGLVRDLLNNLQRGNVNGVSKEPEEGRRQLPLIEMRRDEVAVPILQHAAGLVSAVESLDDRQVWVRYRSAE